jgi:hypothetical protein
VVAAAPGHVNATAARIRRRGGRVTVRVGDLLQIQGTASTLSSVRHTPGVQGAGPAQVGYSDSLISQGVYRTGADALQSEGWTGKGIRIGIVDLGFGTAWRGRLGTELPPADRIDAIQSFDHTTGAPEIAGADANGKPTSHGEEVAEVAHDMAPGASFTLVNYHTELELVQAIDWLIAGPDGRPRVDIVVHSNSFLDGPFDGTGMIAQAVDRARAAGILWVNSAGNYADRHWEGVVGDANGNGWMDIGPPGHDGVEFPIASTASIGATLYWSACKKAGTQIDASTVPLELDVTDTNAAAPVVLARGQADATRPLSTVGYTATADGNLALRVHTPTPGVTCNVEIFGAGVELAGEAVAASSIPTPGDAAGSLSVGAVNWQDDSLAPFSSQGPTEDGRLKPELVAPSGTVVSPGYAMVGTSASAPHVAGAAALLMEQQRAAGQPSDPATIEKLLEDRALDLGPPGPDDQFGYGRLRLDVTPPSIVSTTPAAGSTVRGAPLIGLVADDDGTLDSTTVSIDGVQVAQEPGTARLPWDSRKLPDGPHTAVFTVRDMAGNVSSVQVPFTIDNTPPVILATPFARTATSSTIVIRDAGLPTGRVVVHAVDRRGRIVESFTRRLTFVAGAATLRLDLPGDGLAPFRVTVQATDAAGNVSSPHTFVLRPGPS